MMNRQVPWRGDHNLLSARAGSPTPLKPPLTVESVDEKSEMRT